VTAAAAWTTAVTFDLIVLVVAVIVLGWDRWCPAGTWGCPAAGDRTGRDALVLALLGAALLLVALVALLRGRFLLVVGQLTLVIAVAFAAARTSPAAFDHLREQLHPGTTASQFEFRP
jgi:hypothetical protein